MSFNPYGKDTVQLIREALSKYGITLNAERVEGAKINNGGWPIANMSTYQTCHFYANRCKVKT